MIFSSSELVSIARSEVRAPLTAGQLPAGMLDVLHRLQASSELTEAEVGVFREDVTSIQLHGERR